MKQYKLDFIVAEMESIETKMFSSNIKTQSRLVLDLYDFLHLSFLGCKISQGEKPEFKYKSFINKEQKKAFQRTILCLIKDLSIANTSLIAALVYIERAEIDFQKSTKIDKTRLFLSSLIVACKFLDDCSYDNISWTESTGYSLEELNQMESVFIKKLGNVFCISKTAFSNWSNFVFSYTSRNPVSIYFVEEEKKVFFETNVLLLQKQIFS